MNVVNKLQLLYIPATYWNDPSSSFELISKGEQPSVKSSFFVLWIPSNQSDEELTEHIKLIFPNIPIKKLLSCKINLAIPFSSSKKAFEVISHIGKVIPILPATKLLYQMEIIENPDRSRIHYSNSIKTWALLTKLVFELLNKGQFVPALEPTKEKLYNSQWRLILKSQYDNDRFKSILNHSSWSAFCLPIDIFPENGVIKTNGLWHPSYLFSVFLDSVGDYLIRSTLNKSKFQTFDEFYSAEIKKEVNPDFRLNWDYKFLKTLIKKDNSFKVDEFYESILPTLIQNWSQSALGFQLKYDFTLSLELKYPERVEDDWLLKISLSSHDGTITIPLNELWEGHELKKEIFSKSIEGDEQFLEIILRALGAASKIFPPIKKAFLENIQHEIKLTSSEVMEFLKYPKGLLIQSGFNIVLPEVFIIGGKQRLTARLIIRSKEDVKKKRG